LELRWSHAGSQPRDIPAGAFFFLDVATLQCHSQHGHWLGPCGTDPNSLHAPLSVPPVFGCGVSKSKYRFHILLAAQNAKPRKCIVEFDYDPAKDDLACRHWPV
jgi:hypothetical protein